MFSTTIRYAHHRDESLAALSRIYCAIRDQSGEGYTTFPMVAVYENGKEIGYIAYNGKVFPGSPHDPHADRAPLYDPYAAAPLGATENVGSNFTYPNARPLGDLLKNDLLKKFEVQAVPAEGLGIIKTLLGLDVAEVIAEFSAAYPKAVILSVTPADAINFTVYAFTETGIDSIIEKVRARSADEARAAFLKKHPAAQVTHVDAD